MPSAAVTVTGLRWHEDGLAEWADTAIVRQRSNIISVVSFTDSLPRHMHEEQVKCEYGLFRWMLESERTSYIVCYESVVFWFEMITQKAIDRSFCNTCCKPLPPSSTKEPANVAEIRFVDLKHSSLPGDHVGIFDRCMIVLTEQALLIGVKFEIRSVRSRQEWKHTLETDCGRVLNPDFQDLMHEALDHHW